MDLIADIGATNSRLALVDSTGRIARTETYRNRDFASLELVLQQFVAKMPRPDRAALAIAAPLAGDEVVMTNIDWRFSHQTLRELLAVRELRLLNDFEALAHALPCLRDDADCVRIGGGRALPRAAMGVLGPGSGLGVAAAVPAGEGWVAVAGEGGHVSIPALSDEEAAIVAEHGDATGHCSAETVLSGPGLLRIHATLTRLAGLDLPTLTPAEISARALAGDAVAARTIDVFCGILGAVAGNLALTVGARGGVFIAGGIVPKILELFARSTFRERFVAKGRYRAYLDAIPTSVITTATPAFIGLKAVLGYSP